MNLFLKYGAVGIINTITHWVIFFIAYSFIKNQSTSNLIAFLIAVTISYVLNSFFTFKQKMSEKKFVLFVSFMACMSYIFGELAERMNIYPLLTLVAFSAFSLVFGFIYSKYVVFRR